MQYLQRLGEGIGSPGTGVVDSHELLCGSWELNLSPLEEQQVLLTPELSVQSKMMLMFKT